MLSPAASAVGVKLPSATIPLAWLARSPGWLPQSLFITLTICSGTGASCADAASGKPPRAIAIAPPIMSQRMPTPSSRIRGAFAAAISG